LSRAKIPPMITDSNQVRLAKMTGRRVQEVSNEQSGGVLGSVKPRISCQNGSLLRRVGNGKYDFQIVAFLVPLLSTLTVESRGVLGIEDYE
jgi:hypothetical protein